MNETITINKGQLQASLQQWEQDARDGKMLPIEESRAQPVEQVAQASTDYLWERLKDAVFA